MIKPTALWNLAHECDEEDAENLGKILLLCAGKQVKLDRAWRIHANVVLKDAADLDERIEEKRTKERERKAKLRSASTAACPEVSHDVPRDTTGQDGTPPCPAPYIHTNIHTHTHTLTHTKTNIPQSNINAGKAVVDNSAKPKIDIGLELLEKRIEEFKKAAHKDDGAFFDPDFDPVVIACAICKETSGARRWRGAMNKIGEGAMRDELFAFYRELKAGEEPDSRGATLNARLSRMEGK